MSKTRQASSASRIENKAVGQSVSQCDEEPVSLSLVTQWYNQFLSCLALPRCRTQSVWVKHSKHALHSSLGPSISLHKMLFRQGQDSPSPGVERFHWWPDSENVQLSGKPGWPGKLCIFSIKVATPFYVQMATTNVCSVASIKFWRCSTSLPPRTLIPRPSCRLCWADLPLNNNWAIIMPNSPSSTTDRPPSRSVTQFGCKTISAWRPITRQKLTES